jgi:hypothetical protein
MEAQVAVLADRCCGEDRVLPRNTTPALIATLALLGPGAASAQAPPAGQMVVAGVPQEVFGLGSDASVRSTITVDVRRERMGSATILTIVPRD